jgi:hypothetical protein
MKMESFIKSNLFVVAVALIVGLVLVAVFRAENTHDRVAGKQLFPETTDDSLTEALNAQEESIREIRDHLVALEDRLSYQLSDMDKISQLNKHDILELWKLEEEIDDGDIADISPDSNAENFDIDPDLQQEQEVLEAELRQAEYERQLEDFFASQQEDVSWSAQVESDFQSAFDNYMDQMQLNSVSCGDVMCKVSANMIAVDNVSAEQLPRLDHIIHGEAKWQGQSMFKMDLDTGEITLYLMRDGVDLPRDNS